MYISETLAASQITNYAALGSYRGYIRLFQNIFKHLALSRVRQSVGENHAAVLTLLAFFSPQTALGISEMLNKDYVKIKAQKLRQELATWPQNLRDMPTSRDLDVAARTAKENATSVRFAAGRIDKKE